MKEIIDVYEWMDPIKLKDPERYKLAVKMARDFLEDSLYLVPASSLNEYVLVMGIKVDMRDVLDARIT